MSMSVSLDSLPEKECAPIQALSEKPSDRRRLMDAGFVCGQILCRMDEKNNLYALNRFIVALDEKNAAAVQVLKIKSF